MRTVNPLILAAILLTTLAATVEGAVTDYCIQVSATVQVSPPKITLSWPLEPGQQGSFFVYRRRRGDIYWASAGYAAPTATTFPDTNVVVGEPYEYAVYRSITGTSYFAYGYVYSGIQLPLVETRGKVIVVVESTAAALTTELARLEQDLRGDGWTPIRVPVNRTDTVPSVKAKIVTQYNVDPANTKAVMLLGNVPVPYSGSRAPDGHSNHVGAWPADVYYGDLDGGWTDTGYYPNAGQPLNNNVPGDGKFDQNALPTNLELMVGRIDMANLPAIGVSEQELLRQYLNKDHNFRHKNFTVQRRAIVDDHFGTYGSQPPFAATGWRTFGGLFGAANVQAADWIGTLGNGGGSDVYMWAYGCAWGGDDICGDVVKTADIPVHDPRVVFTAICGSWFGDWNRGNNLLRAQLASRSYTLTSVWGGRPTWYFHHMGMGETIGFSTKANQENTGAYEINTYYARGAHMALLGDPTLRMHIVAPPSNFSGTSAAVLNWSAPAGETVLGYNLYRASSANGPFTKLNATLLTSTSYTDSTVVATPGTYHYMVKTVKLETGSGTYYNASQGIFTSLTTSVTPPPNVPPTASNQSVTLAEDTGKAITLGAADPDGGPQALTYTIVAAPTRGTLTGSGANRSYTPNANFNGSDSFTFRVSDGGANSNTATVSLTVTAVNDAPMASNQSVTLAEDTSKAITLAGTDVDAGATLAYTIITAPRYGTLSGTGANRTYIPAVNYNGSDSFTFQVSDGVANSNTATVSITVTPVNDPPTITSYPVASPNPAVAGTSVQFYSAGSDVELQPLTYTWTFGDGTTGSGATPTHTFATAGTYNATVTISDGLASISASVSVVITAPSTSRPPYTPPTRTPEIQSTEPAPIPTAAVIEEAPVAPPQIETAVPETETTAPTTQPGTLRILKLSASMKFNATGKDTLSLSGVLENVPEIDAAGAIFTIDVGGANAEFVLQDKGRGKSRLGTATVKLGKHTAGGAVPFSVALKNGAWSDDWADEGVEPALNAAGVATNVDVTVMLAGHIFKAQDVPVSYSATPGKKGKLSK